MAINKLDGIGKTELHIYDSIFKKHIKGSLSKNEKQQFIKLLKEKKLIYSTNGDIPIEYIFEKSVFMGNIFKCTPMTFIPRPDTEILVKEAVYFLKNKSNILVFDIGTGTGNIAISLALQNKYLHVYSSDIS